MKTTLPPTRTFPYISFLGAAVSLVVTVVPRIAVPISGFGTSALVIEARPAPRPAPRANAPTKSPTPKPAVAVKPTAVTNPTTALMAINHLMHLA